MQTISEFLEKIRKNDIYLIIAIFLIAFGFRFALHLVVPVTGDATFHYSISKYIADTGEIPSFELVTGYDPFRYPPLFHFLSAFFYKLTSNVTLVSPLFGSLSVVVFFLFSRRFFKDLFPQVLALIMFIPLSFYYSSIGYTESVLFFCVITAYYFYFSYLKTKSEDKKKYYLAFAIIFSALAALSHYHGSIVILSIFFHSIVMKKPKQAFIFLILAGLLASPWYIRNYTEYGNPVWPMISGGKFPEAHQELTTPQSHVQSLTSWFTYDKWKTLFFAFWIGAPNSGEDVENSVSIGQEKIPGFIYFFIIWVILLLILTALMILGFWDMKDNKDLYVFIIALIISIIPLTFLTFTRIMFTALPLFVLSLANGFKIFWHRLEIRLIFLVSLIAFIGISFGYGLIYSNVWNQYVPYFEQISNELPQDSIIVVFNPGEYGYYTGIDTAGIDNVPGRIPTEVYEVSNPSLYLEENNADYFCCDSRKYAVVHERGKELCDFFLNRTPVLNYEKNGIWGKCWATG